VTVLLWPLYARSAWDQAATLVAGKTGEGPSQASIQSFGVGSDSHSVGGNYT
jgi:hypothetical protein